MLNRLGLSRPAIALIGVSFFSADLRDGFGPFFGTYLALNGFLPGTVGFFNTLGGLAAMAVMVPLGAALDGTRMKRALLLAVSLVVTLACGAIFLSTAWGMAAGSRLFSGMAGAAIAPAISAITLGIMGQAGYPMQVGRNQSANHAGTVVTALVGGALGYFYGLFGVFVWMLFNTVMSAVSLMAIRPESIDHVVARGAASDGTVPVGIWKAMTGTPALLGLAATVFLFHLGNAAMTQLLPQMMVSRGAAINPMVFTSAVVVISQGTMILTALLAAWLAVKKGYNIVFIIALTALPLRGLTCALIEGPWVVVPAQILDGFGNGIMGVAVPGLVVRIMNGSGHVAAGMGAVLTTWAIGSALSNLIGGLVAQHFGFSAAYFMLAGIAAIGFLLWIALTPVVRNALTSRAAATA